MIEMNDFKSLLTDILTDLGLELYDFSFQSGVFRVFIERKECPVSLDDCERASRAIGRVFDEKNVIVHRYTLEVSSPGLDRELRNKEEYLRFKGYLAKITVRENNEQNYLLGRIKEVFENSVELETEAGSKTIAFADIVKARLEPELKKQMKARC